ncbi:Hypothetical_protein [Hexamita inflata]|uniref:Hypothetical_protein n=1 Tax=Hexamita inflata TaxID=28002 RepID=A0AA86THR0_9EUKA|nr:Hypothetical protein HINF_LOCUS5595 [Hexamita inflata]
MKLTNPNSRAEQPHALIIVCLMQEIISCRLNHNFTNAIPGMLRFQLKQSQNQFKVNIERKLHLQRPSTCVICAFNCILISKINCKTLKCANLFSSSVNQVQIPLQLQLLEQWCYRFQIFIEHVQISYQAVFQAQKHVNLDHFEHSLEPRFLANSSQIEGLYKIIALHNHNPSKLIQEH